MCRRIIVRHTLLDRCRGVHGSYSSSSTYRGLLDILCDERVWMKVVQLDLPLVQVLVHRRDSDASLQKTQDKSK
jgi:hypothetical protein